MAELSTRYATALFGLSLESGAPDEWIDQATLIRDAMQTGECKLIMEHPQITDAEKRDFLDGLFGKRVNKELMGFLCLAIAKSRESYIVPALTSFIKMANSQAGKTEARVTSAMALTEAQQSALTALLSKKLQKQVTIIPAVDPSLIGGLTIHVDGYLIDRTVIKQLKDIQNQCKRGAPDDTQA